MKQSLSVSVLCLGIVIGLAVGFVIGWRQRQFDLPLEENKIAVANLKFNNTNLPPHFQSI